MRNLLRELRTLRAEVTALRAEVAALRTRPPVVTVSSNDEDPWLIGAIDTNVLSRFTGSPLHVALGLV